MIRSLLTIRRLNDRYELSVCEETPGDGAGPSEVTGSIPLPLPPFPESGDDPIAVLAPLLTTDAPVAVRPQDACSYLYSLLADNGLGDWLEEVRRQDQRRSVRLDVDDPGLRRLPWEMLMDPVTAWVPFVDTQSTWARGPATLADLEPVMPPVRVLFVAGDYDDVNPANDPRLSADDELDAIFRTLCRRPAEFHVEYLVAPTKAQFDAAYEEVKPHVLHVVAHGAQAFKETVLTFRNGKEGAWALTKGHVTNVLRPYPRLVVLNACRSGASPDSGTAAWGFAELFIDRGAGAVVTMQGDIPDQAGVDFAEAFYAGIADGLPVDVATRAGRTAIFKGSEAPEHWAIPTLTLRSTAESVLAIPRPRPLPQRMQDIVEEAVHCVDRAPERRHVWTNAAPPSEVKPPRLIIVTGGEHAGKSAVVKGAIPACHARGCDIAYVDFGPAERLGWFAAVKRIHDHLLEWIPERQDLIADFANVAERSRTGVYREDPRLARLPLSDSVRFVNEEDTGEHRKNLIFRELRGLVEKCSRENKLMLVLDHLFSGLSDEALDDYILPKFVKPLLDEPESNVILVTVVSDPKALRLDLQNGTLDLVAIPDFQKPNFEFLLREYLARRDPASRLKVEQKTLVKQLALVKDCWNLKDLRSFGSAARQAGQ